MDEEQLRFIFRLLALPEPRFGPGGEPGLSTKCIQWVIAYMVEYETGEAKSYRQLSMYLGFNQIFHVGLFDAMRKFEACLIPRNMAEGGVRNEVY